MALVGRVRTIAALALAGLVAGCGAAGRDRAAEGLGLSFEDRPEPEVFVIEGHAGRDGADGAAGLWAVVGGLPRPERARVENLRTGAETVVALFESGSGGGIRLSGEAADALGIGPEGGDVRITALRRTPVIEVGR